MISPKQKKSEHDYHIIWDLLWLYEPQFKKDNDKYVFLIITIMLS